MKYLLLTVVCALTACSHIEPESNGGGYDWATEYRLRIRDIEEHLNRIDPVCDYDTWLRLTEEHKVLTLKLIQNGYEI